MTVSDFFFNIPIYSKINITDENIEEIRDIVNTNITFEGYNPDLKRDSTFEIYYRYDNSVYHDFFKTSGIKNIQIKCKRTDVIFYFFIKYDKTNNNIMKIGQYPSVADFHISEIKKYNKILLKDKQSEFTRAIGLAANGVGIGSFVYLRRIFEYLIYETFEECKKQDLINEEEFNKAKMNDKISLLSSHLPNFLVENKNMYSILSKGIHELEEDICLKYFDALRVGIEIILDEKLDEFNKKQKMEEAKKKIASIQV